MRCPVWTTVLRPFTAQSEAMGRQTDGWRDRQTGEPNELAEEQIGRRECGTAGVENSAIHSTCHYCLNETTTCSSPLLVALLVSTAEALTQGRSSDCSLPVIKAREWQLIYQTSVVNIKNIDLFRTCPTQECSQDDCSLYYFLKWWVLTQSGTQGTLTSNRSPATVPFQNCLTERLNFLFGLKVAEVEQPLP